jgi:hypothetical protein
MRCKINNQNKRITATTLWKYKKNYEFHYCTPTPLKSKNGTSYKLIAKLKRNNNNDEEARECSPIIIWEGLSFW